MCVAAARTIKTARPVAAVEPVAVPMFLGPGLPS